MSEIIKITGQLEPIDKYDMLYVNCIDVLSTIGVICSMDTCEQEILNNYSYDLFPYIIINGALYKIINRADEYYYKKGYNYGFDVSRNENDTLDFVIAYDIKKFTFDDMIFEALEYGS